MKQEKEKRLPEAVYLSWLKEMGFSAQTESLALDRSSFVTVGKVEYKRGRQKNVLLGVDRYYFVITSFAQWSRQENHQLNVNIGEDMLEVWGGLREHKDKTGEIKYDGWWKKGSTEVHVHEFKETPVEIAV